MIQLSQRVTFSGSHTLERPGQPDAAGSREYHGHDYFALLFFRGQIDPATGMLIDAGELQRAFSPIQQTIERTSMNDVENLGPATVENLAVYIWNRLKPDFQALHRIDVGRDAHGDTASYWGPDAVFADLPDPAIKAA